LDIQYGIDIDWTKSLQNSQCIIHILTPFPLFPVPFGTPQKPLFSDNSFANNFIGARKTSVAAPTKGKVAAVSTFETEGKSNPAVVDSLLCHFCTIW